MPALPLACLINVEEECNRDQADKYLNGECHLFAIAIARLTNWKIGAITEPRAVFRDSGILSLKGLNHAFCYSPDFPDWCFDALGWRRYQDVVEEYPLHPDCRLEELTQTQLFEIVYPGEEVCESDLNEVNSFINTFLKHFIF